MDNTESILDKINSLSDEKKIEIYHKLKENLLRSLNKNINIQRYKGIAKNIWEKDAQEYINELRDHDRI